jgi:hypothetical protein
MTPKKGAKTQCRNLTRFVAPSATIHLIFIQKDPIKAVDKGRGGWYTDKAALGRANIEKAIQYQKNASFQWKLKRTRKA